MKAHYRNSVPLKLECHGFIINLGEVLHDIGKLKGLAQAPSCLDTLSLLLILNTVRDR